MSTLPIWRLQPGKDRRFRAGHPWVYSNELAGSPKGIEPGALVELRGGKDGKEFLARGYGNPKSLIAFRVLSRDLDVTDPTTEVEILKRLAQAQRLRELAGLHEFSHRLIFGEADRLPGLVIDRYRLAPGTDKNAQPAQVFVVQAHTAGAQQMLSQVRSALLKFAGDAPTAMVLRNDLGVRRLEGLEEEEPQVLKSLSGFDLSAAKILISAADGQNVRSLEFEVDLVHGQKTGFFLDQFGNVRLAAQLLKRLKPAKGDTLRILDLCCYVGQWSAQLSRVFRDQGHQVQVLAVDASEKALAQAKRNIEAQGAQCETLKTDVLKGLESLDAASFDLVVCDPPALIKGRKDIGPGTHAYLTVNTQVFRLARPGGGVVSCSCSALLEDEEFARVLTKAAARNRLDARWLGRGAPASDHPMLTEFPEGRYLKAWVGVVV